jgi:hypothetical protein
MLLLSIEAELPTGDIIEVQVQSIRIEQFDSCLKHRQVLFDGGKRLGGCIGVRKSGHAIFKVGHANSQFGGPQDIIPATVSEGDAAFSITAAGGVD